MVGYLGNTQQVLTASSLLAPAPPSRPKSALEVLFAPDKIEAGFAIHVAFDVQLAPEYLGSAEEHACLGRRVDLADRLEHRVPVGSTEIRWRAEPRDGVLIRIRVVDHDVGRVIGFDLGREVLWKLRLASPWSDWSGLER